VRERNLAVGLGIILTGLLLVGILTYSGGLRGVLAVPEESFGKYEKLKIFTDVLSYVERNYVKQVDMEKLIYGAIKGMLASLDPHSSFMPPDMFKELQVETKGQFEGLGIEITIRNGVLTVVSPIDDTPAFKAGIKAGDKIIKIDGVPTKNMTLMDAIKRLRGPKGTKVTISIMRKGWTELKDFTITRDVISITSVKSMKLPEGFGYIRIRHFQQNTSKELDRALKDLQSSPRGLRGLILDLRNNPGGLLPQAVKVADKFIPEGLIVYTEGRTEKKEYRAHKEGTYLGFPMVVLVNGGSASASEIVAGALQDHGRALILGSPTFGKGSVQSIYGPLEDGSGLRLTIALYYTPKGHAIQARGIIPDITVEEGQWVYKPSSKESRLIREQDLTGHLEGKEAPTPAITEGLPDDMKGDVQLIRAIELLKSWYVFRSLAETEKSMK
jgi:carboxyl-terminal processing protease